MTAAIKPEIWSSRLKSTTQPDTLTGTAKVTPIDKKKSTGGTAARVEQTVQMMPSQDQLPLWLRSLMGASTGSAILSLILVAACLGVYGLTVYSQQKWQQEATKLNSLRRDERQLIAANETLKNQIAKVAERPTSGLVQPSPQQMLFLSPAPESKVPLSSSKSNKLKQDPDSSPLGY